MGLGNAIGIGIPMVSLGLGGGEPAIDSRFIIQVKTDNPGSTSNNGFRLPWVSPEAIDIDWGDGNVDTGVTGQQTHAYASSGIYDIKVTALTGQMRFAGGGDNEKLIDIKNWGTCVWQDFFVAYNGCSSMTMSATDAPDLSAVTSLLGAFANCSVFNSSINHWDVSNVESFANLFYKTNIYNKPLDLWDMSSATDISSMFEEANAFNQNIGSWDVSNVTVIDRMFKKTLAFNNGGSADINNWNFPLVTSMYEMFGNSESFNQPIGNWNVSGVTNMEALFRQAYVGPLTQESFNTWDVSSVTTMRQMFLRGLDFLALNPNITDWNTQNVVDFNGFLQQSTGFNRDLSNWNISSGMSFGLTFGTNNGIDNAVIGDISNWVITQGPNFQNFFGGNQGGGFTTAIYDNILVAWEAQLQAAYPGGTGAPAGNIGFQPSTYTLGTAAETARASIINTFGWIILDGGGV